MASERDSFLFLSPIRGLMKIQDDMRISDDAVISIRSAIEMIGVSITKEASTFTSNAQRKTIMQSDIIDAGKKLGYPVEELTAYDRLAPTQLYRLMKETIPNKKISEKSTQYLRLILENLIVNFSEQAFAIASQTGRITLQVDDILTITKNYVKISFGGPQLDEILVEWVIRDDIVKLCNQENISCHKKYSRTLLRALMSIHEPDQIIDQLLSKDTLGQLATTLKIPKNLAKRDIIDRITNRYSVKPFSEKELESMQVISEEEVYTTDPEKIQETQIIDAVSDEFSADLAEPVFDQAFQPSLKSLISENLLVDEIDKIADLYQIDITTLETPEEMTEYLLSCGVSIISFLRVMKVDSLRKFLTDAKLKKSGNKNELIFRIITLISFLDYDITVDDFQLHRSDEGKYISQMERKTPEEIIRSYSGTARFDLLKVLVENEGRLNSDDLLNKYLTDSGRHRVTFSPTMQALIRNKIIVEERGKDDIFYHIPNQLISITTNCIQGIEKSVKELEGIMDDLAGSRLNLLSLLCNYEGKRPVNDVKQEFKEFFSNPTTFNNSVSELKSRDLIIQEYDDELETDVIYSIKNACPIISGLLPKYKEKLAEASQLEQLKMNQISALQTMDENGLDLLYIVNNSGGSIRKDALKNSYTTPPGIHFSSSTFYRYLRINLENEILREEEIIINDQPIQYILIPNEIREEVIKEIETRLLLKQEDLLEEIAGTPKKALILLKIVTEYGGLMTYRDLRTHFTERFTSEEFTKAINLIDGNFLHEGISESGDQLIVLPERYYQPLEQFLNEKAIELPPKIEKPITTIDFISNYGNPESIKRIASQFEIDIERSIEEIVDDLLFSKGLSFRQLIDKSVSKALLKDYLRKHKLKVSGRKKELLDRLITNDKIIIEDELVETIDSELKITEKMIETEIEPVPEIISFDSDLLFESIKIGHTVEKLRSFAIEYNTKRSGNKTELVANLLSNQTTDLNKTLDRLLTDHAVEYIQVQLNDPSRTKEVLINDALENIFNIKQEELSFLNVLNQYTNNELKSLCETLNCPVSGEKEQKIETILSNDSERVKVTLIQLFPEKFETIKKKFQDKDFLTLFPETLVEEVKQQNILDISKLKGLEGLRQIVISSIGEEKLLEQIGNNSFEIFVENEGVKDVIVDFVDYTIIDELVSQIDENLPSMRPSKKLTSLMKHLELEDQVEQVDLLSAQTSDVFKNKLGKIRDEVWIKKYTELSYGKIDKKSDFATSDDHAKRISSVVSDANLPKLSGALFEWSTYRVLNFLRSISVGRKDGIFLYEVKPRINLYDPLGVDRFSKDDGQIIFKEYKDGEFKKRLIFNYDCKAYSKRFNPGRHLDKAISYIREEAGFREDENSEYRGFIYFASDFSGQVSTVRKNLTKVNLDPKLKVLMFKAKDLRTLAETIWQWGADNWEASNYRINVRQYLDWQKILGVPDQAEVFKGDQINEMIEIAKERAEHQLERKRGT